MDNQQQVQQQNRQPDGQHQPAQQHPIQSTMMHRPEIRLSDNVHDPMSQIEESKAEKDEKLKSAEQGKKRKEVDAKENDGTFSPSKHTNHVATTQGAMAVTLAPASTAQGQDHDPIHMEQDPEDFDNLSTLATRHPPSFIVNSSSQALSDSTPSGNPLIEAVLVPEESGSWWKKHRRSIVFSLILVCGAMAVAVGVLANRQQRSNDQPSSSTTGNNNINRNGYLTSEYIQNNELCARFIGTLFEVDCDNCNPRVAIEDSAIVISGEDQIYFLSISDQKSDGLPSQVSYHTEYMVNSIAVSGSQALVGSSSKKPGTVDVYEKTRSGLWAEIEELVPSDIDADSEYGRSVDIRGDVIVVGARDDDLVGSVYVYRRGTSGDDGSGGDGGVWKLEQKLTPEVRNLAAEFGYSVLVKTNVVVVGDRNYDGMKGAVFVYDYNSTDSSWKKRKDDITNDECQSGFGSSMAWTVDDGLIIGCPGGGSNSVGALYHYERSGTNEYVHMRQIELSSDAPDGYFGVSDQIATDGNILVANGKVYAYVLNVWTVVAEINTPNNVDKFGRVAISGNTFLIASSDNVFDYSLERCQN